MTDPQQQQDPLAALEELLKDSKGAGGADPQTQAAKQEEADAAAEEQKKKEVEALEAQQKQEDAAALRNQIADLQGIADTPQEQARLEQKEKHEEQQQQQSAHQEEYQIRQLGHTKV